jgi:hypothetical protein
MRQGGVLYYIFGDHLTPLAPLDGVLKASSLLSSGGLVAC